MLISCPACPKMYRVPASAIPPEGREVSCSACGTVWYERGIEAEVVSVGAGAFSASATAPSRHACHHHEEAPRPRPRAEASVKAEAPRKKPTPEASNVVALWGPERSHPDWDEVPTPEPLKEPATEHRAARAKEPAEDVTAAETAKAAEEVASFFNSEKWEAQLPSFDDLKARFDGWRKTRQERTLNDGTDATLKYRERIRARERNRLTPMRRLGWSLWILALSAVTVNICDRDLMEELWPQSGKLYAALFGARDVTAPLELKNVTTRYAQSIEGPVLEIRGTVINSGATPVMPLLELSVDGEVLADYGAVSLSEVTVPVRGERPFVVRAMLPEGTARADIRMLAGAPAQPAETGGFILQQTGSGWGEATLPPLPLEALETAR